MCVVNKKNLIVSNNGMSKVPMMVNKIMIAMEIIIGPIELSVKQDNNNDRDATTCKLRKAIKNASKNLHSMSFSLKITICSVFKTTRSPLPNISKPRPNAKTPSQSNKSVR